MDQIFQQIDRQLEEYAEEVTYSSLCGQLSIEPSLAKKILYAYVQRCADASKSPRLLSVLYLVSALSDYSESDFGVVDNQKGDGAKCTDGAEDPYSKEKLRHVYIQKLFPSVHEARSFRDTLQSRGCSQVTIQVYSVTMLSVSGKIGDLSWQRECRRTQQKLKEAKERDELWMPPHCTVFPDPAKATIRQFHQSLKSGVSLPSPNVPTTSVALQSAKTLSDAMDQTKSKANVAFKTSPPQPEIVENEKNHTPELQSLQSAINNSTVMANDTQLHGRAKMSVVRAGSDGKPPRSPEALKRRKISQPQSSESSTVTARQLFASASDEDNSAKKLTLKLQEGTRSTETSTVEEPPTHLSEETARRKRRSPIIEKANQVDGASHSNGVNTEPLHLKEKKPAAVHCVPKVAQSASNDCDTSSATNENCISVNGRCEERDAVRQEQQQSEAVRFTAKQKAVVTKTYKRGKYLVVEDTEEVRRVEQTTSAPSASPTAVTADSRQHERGASRGGGNDETSKANVRSKASPGQQQTSIRSFFTAGKANTSRNDN